MKIVERVHNLETNEIIDIERDATSEELAEVNRAKAELESVLEAQKKAAIAKAALLEKLGITEEEAKLLLG